jgi:hypothetical protein
MSTRDEATVAALIARTRRTLAAESLASGLRDALALAGPLVLGLGLVHGLVRPVPLWLAAGLAMLVVAANGVRALARPATEAAAAEALDRRLGAAALFQSALDQLRRPPAERAPAASFVIGAAARAAASGAQIPPRPVDTRRGRLSAAGAVTAWCGALLLLGAGADLGSPPHARAPDTRESAGRVPSPLLRALREPAPAGAPPRRELADGTGSAPASGGGADVAADAEAGRKSRAGIGDTAGRRPGGGGRTPGRDVGTGGSPGAPIAAAEAPARIVPVDLVRPGSGGEASTVPTPIRAGDGAVSFAPATPPPLPARSVSGAALRAWAAAAAPQRAR